MDHNVAKKNSFCEHSCKILHCYQNIQLLASTINYIKLGKASTRLPFKNGRWGNLTTTCLFELFVRKITMNKKMRYIFYVYVIVNTLVY